MGDLSESLEDYLEAIYIFTKEKQVTRVKDLSKHMGVKTPSVVGAIKSLRKAGLVRQEHYGYIELTENGLEKAGQIFEKHRIITYFFQKILGVQREIAEQDACSLEHHIHAETYEKIIQLFEFLEHSSEGASFLRNFHQFLATGEKLGKAKDESLKIIPLSQIKEGEKGKIIKINADQKTRKYFLALGVITGEIIMMSDQENCQYKIKDNKLSLNKEEAGLIEVEIIS